MKRRTIRAKLLGSFGVLIAMAALIGLLGHFEISAINYQNRIGALANRILVDAQDAQAHSLRFIIYGEQRYFDEMGTELENVLTQADQAQSLMRRESNRENTESLKEAARRYQENNDAYYEVYRARLSSGAIRVERAQRMLADLIRVIEAARDFSYTTQISVGGRQYLERSSVERVWLVQEARNATNRFRISAQKYQLATDPAEQDRIASEWVAEIALVRSLLAEALGLMQSAVTREAISDALAALEEYEAQVNIFRTQNRELREIQEQQRSNAAEVMAEGRDVRDGVAEAIEATTVNANTLLLVLLTVALVTATVLTVWIVRSITRSLGCEPGEIAEITGRIAAGDLSGRFDKQNHIGAYASMKEMNERLNILIGTVKQRTDRLDAVGTDLAANSEQTSAALNQVTDNIASINEHIKRQKRSVEEVTTAVAQITSNIESLNESVNDQASQVVESSSAVEEMVSSINRVAENMASVYQATQDLKESGEEGLDKMTRSNERIKQVAEESKKLMDTNRLISDIASKTNLLAMNASIEAAHAGEAGKGFSVVADEIRKLAESTGTQSREVSDMLKAIQTLISDIVTDSDETTDSFTTIRDMVSGVNERSAEVQQAMAEQSSGSKQILEALGNMTQITQAVRDGADEIRNGSALVLQETVSLKESSDESSARVSSIASSITEINQAVSGVMSISGTNKEMVNGIVSEMATFRTADTSLGSNGGEGAVGELQPVGPDYPERSA